MQAPDYNQKHLLKGGCKVFGHIFLIVKVIATVSRHVLHPPLTPSIFCQFPVFKHLWEGKARQCQQYYSLFYIIIYHRICSVSEHF